MPKILEFKTYNFDEIIKILNKVKDNIDIEMKEVEIVKIMINNSMVGTSKLLHFINPNAYPIWDSKVSKYCFNKNSNFFISKVNNYFEYKSFLDNYITANKNFKEIYNKAKGKLKYSSLSKYRAIESVIFLAQAEEA